jgi:hypothetical protein
MDFMTKRLRHTLFAAFTVAFALAAANAQTAPTAFPVPFTTALAGLGSSAASTCSANILATDGTNYGDGCVGTLARLSSPQGAAVDQYGNVYVADYSDRLVRVIYHGGAAVKAAILAANSGYAISASRNAPATMPVVGDIYTIAGVGAGLTAFTATATDSKYACANYAGSGQPEAIDSVGDGCPASASIVGARDVTIDGNGNLVITDYTNNRIRILCVDCATGTPAAQLIALENPGATIVNGNIYTVAGYTVGYRDGYPGFTNPSTAETGNSLFRDPTAAAVTSMEDIFVADNQNSAVRVVYNGGTAAKNILTAEGYTPQLGYVYTIAGAGCMSAATNKLGTTQSANSCLTLTDSDTAGLATVPGATLTTATGGVGANVVWTVYLDANGNVYYTDEGNARIKLIYAGIGAPLTLPNTAYPTLHTGYTYTFAGQGTLNKSGVAPSQLQMSSSQGVGGDANGDIFFNDYNTGQFYEVYTQTGIAAIIGGGDAIASGSAGAYCNGGSNGPTMTDAYYNGCPLTQTAFSGARGPIVADAAGNLYFGDSPGYFLREFSYNAVFPTVAVGTATASQALAFTSATTVGAGSVVEGGTAGTDFYDTGSDTCPTTVAGTTCVINVAFKPATPGIHTGAAVAVQSSVVQGFTVLSGTGTGAGLDVDPGTATTTGTTLTPDGVAVDGAGDVYVADGASKSLLRYTGGVATTVTSGFTSPAGVAVDGAGNVFVADSGANTIEEVPAVAPSIPFTLASGLGNPHGLATDAAGDLYVADTGNNRVLLFRAGSADGAYTVEGFTGLNAPQDVAVDLNGNVYVVDSTHVVKLTPAGVQTTVATAGGSGVAVDAAGNVLVTMGTTLVEYPAGGGSAVTLSSALTTPLGLALDGYGNAYIADSGLKGYYELQRTAGYYKFLANPSSTTIELSSTGTAAVSTTAFTQSETTDYSVVAATTNGCSGALAAGNTCALTAKFAGTSDCVTPDNVVFTAPVSNGAPGLTLTSVSVAPCLSVTALPSSIIYGATETLTADVSGTSSSGGSVTFYSGTTQLATEAVSGGTASYSYVPPVNTYSVTATFTPMGGGAPTLTSQPASFTVGQATPSIALTSSPSSGYTTTSFTFQATVTASYGTPTGAVTFYAGTTSLGSATISGNTASLSVANLPVGTDCITATYGSDTNFTSVSSTGCSNITVAPGFGVTASTSALSFSAASYQEAQAYLTVAPGGRTDTLSFACNGLPAKLSCAFSPATLALSGLSTAQSVQMLVSNSSAQASIAPVTRGTGRTIAFAGIGLGTLLLLGIRRGRMPAMLLLAVMMLAGMTLMSGCGNSPVALEQSGGTYPFAVVVSNGTSTLQTLNFTVTVPN